MADVSHHGLRHPRRNHHINCHRHGDVSLQNLTVLPLDVFEKRFEKPKNGAVSGAEVVFWFFQKNNPQGLKKSEIRSKQAQQPKKENERRGRW